MSEQINVESIMKEIKKEIEVKGYTNDLLSFDDVIVDVGSMNVNKFDKVKFNEDIYVANHEWEVNPYRPLQGGKVTVFFKKAIRKLVYFFVEPIVMAQDGFKGRKVICVFFSYYLLLLMAMLLVMIQWLWKRQLSRWDIRQEYMPKA